MINWTSTDAGRAPDPGDVPLDVRVAERETVGAVG